MSSSTAETHVDTKRDEATIERHIRVVAREVVYIKGICEASEGLCTMYAERGGDLILSASASRARELDELIADLCVDFGAVLNHHVG